MQKDYHYPGRWPYYIVFCLTFIACLSPIIYYNALYVPAWIFIPVASMVIIPAFTYAGNRLFLKAVLTDGGLACRTLTQSVSARWEDISVLPVKAPGLMMGSSNSLLISFKGKADIFIHDSIRNSSTGNQAALPEIMEEAQRHNARIYLKEGFSIRRTSKIDTRIMTVVLILVGVFALYLTVFVHWAWSLVFLLDILLHAVAYGAYPGDQSSSFKKIAITKRGIVLGVELFSQIRWSSIREYRMMDGTITIETKRETITFENPAHPEKVTMLYESIREMRS